MTISSLSLRKMFREHFTGGDPLRPDKKQRKEILATLKQHFKDDEWVDVDERTAWRYRDQPDRFLATLHLNDPQIGYYYTRTAVELRIGDGGALEAESAGGSAPVSSLEEIYSLMVEGKRRLERKRALRSRREKVNQFKNTAMITQLKQLADQEKFDFSTEFSPQRIKLWVRLNETQVLEIFVSPKQFHETLPKLGAAIRSLRETWETGLSFKTATRRALPWDAKWVKYNRSKD